MKITTLPTLDSLPPFFSIGKQITLARRDCGLNQFELAQQIGYRTGVAISFLESDKRQVSAQKLRLIAHVTNKPIGFFFEASLSVNPNPK